MKSKRCTKCGEMKSLTEFHRDSEMKDGRFNKCKECRLMWAKEYYKITPWLSHCISTRGRCSQKYHSAYKYYGGRGIKLLMNLKDFEFLWFRDKAYFMKKPSVDRIDNNGNYVLENCRFLESFENNSRAHLGQPAWNKGTKGIMKANKTSFKKGHTQRNKCKGYLKEKQK